MALGSAHEVPEKVTGKPRGVPFPTRKIRGYLDWPHLCKRTDGEPDRRNPSSLRTPSENLAIQGKGCLSDPRCAKLVRLETGFGVTRSRGSPQRTNCLSWAWAAKHTDLGLVHPSHHWLQSGEQGHRNQHIRPHQSTLVVHCFIIAEHVSP